MKGKTLKDLVQNVDDEADVYIEVDGLDCDIASYTYNEQYQYLLLIPILDEDDDESPHEGEDDTRTGNLCTVKEAPVLSSSIKSL